jgi:hypothetical protein
VSRCRLVIISRITHVDSRNDGDGAVQMRAGLRRTRDTRRTHRRRKLHSADRSATARAGASMDSLREPLDVTRDVTCRPAGSSFA